MPSTTYFAAISLSIGPSSPVAGEEKKARPTATRSTPSVSSSRRRTSAQTRACASEEY